MRSSWVVIACCALVASSAGCGVLRCIEQWKCDHLGMCHCGVTPTPACPPALAPIEPGCCNQPHVMHDPAAPPYDYLPEQMPAFDPYINQ